MSRDSKLSRRNSGKNMKFDEVENLPVNVNLREPSIGRVSIDSHSRPPLNTIQEPIQNPSKSDHELGLKSSKIYRTPTKPKVRNLESGIALKTPEKQGGLNRNRYGWGFESRDDMRIGNGNGNTPKPCKSIPRCLHEPNSTHSTPTKSVGKPPNLGFFNGGSSRPPVNGGVRTGNFAALSKGIPVAFNTCTTVNTADVPHFELREDPSFWMDHNVQVLIRIRPLNGIEIGSQGYNRCLKQESAQTLTWISQPETRFTFDHVACETIDQETLFKMVGQPMVENCLSGYNSCMFAYGQTGSGKTHTMLGEINDLEIKPSPNRGMTPRIFEFLFARIIAEEESRTDERLKYTCKCSFLEIYNEQITDLLDPSSTNLQLREDVKKGVYVENLTEYEVHSVGDILKLLSQGSANRRVAATNMNRESSRSHSVFTCVIESRWEKDSTSNLRFARLNLVDLAGSERQKTSGAEGERLKEAANINKSLSTLGHVIMVLVDGANSRIRHVPYRDSRLTFLLQDSLGGNSKTMIIANVSPSISSAIETLNTLKFAQRAKLIQNNAVINEDASGDVVALQHQIRLLKEELAILKRQNTSRSLTFSSNDENCSNASSYQDEDKRVSCNQLKSLESSLNGALRREKSTENCIKQLEAEIEQLNSLVRQREEENRCTKMMLKFREDKIQKMESVFSGLISADSYLVEENNTLTEEIKILHAKVDKNPEVTRFAVENIRLLEQLKRFQDFYEEGERELLLAEVSELRDQLALLLDEHNHMNLRTDKEAAKDKKEIDSLQFELLKSQEELEKCRYNLNSCIEENKKLCREISDLNALLERQKSSLNDQDGGVEIMKESILESSSIEDTKDEMFKRYPEEIVGLQLELELLRTIFKEERYEKNLKEKDIQQELTLLREMYDEKDRKFNGLSEEFDLLTKKIEEVLTVGHNALDDASNFIGPGKQTRVCENLQIIARKISEKELRIDELSTCLEDAKVQGNVMETMLRSLRGAILVMSEAHQKDCIKKNEEIDKLLSELNEKNSVINLIEEQRKLYEAELMDAKINAAHQETESCCYLDKFAEFQNNIKEANLMINTLVTENEAMKMEISHQNQVISDKDEKLRCLESAESTNLRNEKIHMSTVFKKLKEEIIVSYVDMQLKDWILLEKEAEVGLLLKEKEPYEVQHMDAMKYITQHALESCCYLDKFKEARLMVNKLVNENEAGKIEINELKRNEINFINEREIMKDSYFALEKQINEKDEELRCLEEKIVSDLSAKDIELFMLSSKLEQVASEYSDLEKGKVSMSEVFEKFKEEIVICNVDSHFKDLILLEQELKNKDESEEFEACFESLEYEHYENIVKSLVLEAQLTENVEDALKAKKSAEEQLAKTKKAMEDIELKTNFDRNNLMESLKDELESVTCERDDLHVELVKAKQLYELELMDAKINAAQQTVESCCYLDKFVETQNNLKKADYIINTLMTDLSAKETEVCTMSSKIQEVVSENNDLETEKISMSKVFEKFQEDIFIFHVDLHFKDLILMELDAELRLHKLENKSLGVMIKYQEDQMLNHRSFCEVVERQLYENKLKISVLESLSTENASNAKSATEQLTRFQELYEIELTDAEIKLQEADLMVKKLVTENEAMKVEIGHQNQVINAKEIELFIILSKLEQVALDYNDLKKEKISVYSVFEKLKEEILISYLDQYFKDLILLENDAEIGALQMAFETRKHNDQEKLKLYEKSVEELESTVNLLENQVDLVKGDAESQRLKNAELKEEVEKIRQQKQLLISENETFKEENDMLKARNDENSDTLQKAEAIVSRVREEIANLHASKSVLMTNKQLHEKETGKNTNIIVHLG